MELQHLNLKLYLEHHDTLNLGELMPIFHHWIQGQVCKELLIDVTYYRHVSAEPHMVALRSKSRRLPSVDDPRQYWVTAMTLKRSYPAGVGIDLPKLLRAPLEACERLESR